MALQFSTFWQLFFLFCSSTPTKTFPSTQRKTLTLYTMLTRPISSACTCSEHSATYTSGNFRGLCSKYDYCFSGFALFLWIIISRLAGLLADKARVKAEAVAAKAQAASASKTAELLLDENQKREKEGKAGLDDEVKSEIADLKKRLESVSKRLEKIFLKYTGHFKGKFLRMWSNKGISGPKSRKRGRKSR